MDRDMWQEPDEEDEEEEQSENQEGEYDTEFEEDLMYGRESLSLRLEPADLIEQLTSVPRYDGAPRINWLIDPRTQQRGPSTPHRIEDDQGRRADDDYRTRLDK
jgi:hypothetical protein